MKESFIYMTDAENSEAKGAESRERNQTEDNSGFLTRRSEASLVRESSSNWEALLITGQINKRTDINTDSFSAGSRFIFLGPSSSVRSRERPGVGVLVLPDKNSPCS